MTGMFDQFEQDMHRAKMSSSANVAIVCAKSLCYRIKLLDFVIAGVLWVYSHEDGGGSAYI